jgi:hypothetical protein
MSVVDEPVVVYRFRAGQVEDADGAFAASLPEGVSHALDAPLVLPGGPELDHAVVLADALHLPTRPALLDARCFAVDVMLHAAHASDALMQILTGHALPLSLALAAIPGIGWCLQGAVHVRHAGPRDAHWCHALAWEPVPGTSDTATAHDTFRASAPGWVCASLVFTGDELVLLQDGVVIGRRVFRAATLSVPGDAGGFTLGADPGDRHAFHGAIAGVRLWNGIPALYRAAMLHAERRGLGVLASKRADLDEIAPSVASALGDQRHAERGLRLAGVAGRICEHEHGALLWSRDTGAHVVHGVIHDVYQSPRQRNRLGWPLADERAPAEPGVPTGHSRIQRFQHGVIVWSADTGAHVVDGPIFLRYVALGAELGPLGLPIQRSLRAQPVTYQEFQHGRLVHTPATGTHALHGPTLERYLALPGRAALLGYPVSDTTPIHASGGALLGHVSHFERGAIYWSPRNGAWEVCGRVALHYQCCGGPAGALGFPLAAAHDLDIEPPPAAAEPTPAVTEPAPAAAGVSPAATEPTPAATEPAPEITELAPAATEPTLAATEPTSPATESTLAPAELTPPATESTPAPAATTLAPAELASAATKLTPPATELTPPATELTPPATEPPPPATELTPPATELTPPATALTPPATALTPPATALTAAALASGPAAHGDTAYARFEHGLIAHRRDRGTCALQAVRLRLERVRRLRDTSVAAFSIRVWLRVDEQWAHRDTRLPGQGYAVSSAGLALTHFFAVQPETEVWFRVELCDHGAGDRVLGAIEQRFGIRDLWGIWGGDNGSYEVPIAVAGEPEAFTLAFRASPVAESAPARLPADPAGMVGCGAFRRLGWWRFGNFRARALARELVAESFRPPLPAASACWPEPPASLPGLWEPSFQDTAYAGVASNGTCFGLVTTAMHALAGSTSLTQPVARYHLTPQVRAEIVHRHAQQLGAEVITWMASLLAAPASLSPRAVFDQLERALRLHTPVPLCIYDVPGDRGDCLLAYACTRADTGGDYGHIFVADPNAPRSLSRHEPVLIRILPDDTFQLAPQPERFRNQRAGDDLLPDILLLTVPFHVIAHPPGLPYAELGLALDARLGGLILLSGDAEMDQIASSHPEPQQELQRKVGGRRHLVARVLPGLVRVPRLQASPASQLYAQRGPLPGSLDLHIKGAKARGGRFEICVGTYHGELVVDAPIDRGAVDTVGLRAANVFVPELHMTTTMPAKLVRVAYRLHRDPRGRPPRGLAFDLPLAPDDLAIVRMDSGGGSVSIRPAGPVRPLDLLLEAQEGGQVQQVRLPGLVVGAPGETLRVWPRDWAALGSGIVVERLSSPDGAVLQRQLVFGQAP